MKCVNIHKVYLPKIDNGNRNPTKEGIFWAITKSAVYIVMFEITLLEKIVVKTSLPFWVKKPLPPPLNQS